MLENMSASQFYEHVEYFSIEPFDFQMENYRSGVIASAIYNTNRTKQSDKVWEPSDFFDFESKQQQQSLDEQLLFAEYISNAYNAKGGQNN